MQGASSLVFDNSLVNNIATISTDFLGCEPSPSKPLESKLCTNAWIKPAGLLVATMISPALVYGAPTEIPDFWNKANTYCEAKIIPGQFSVFAQCQLLNDSEIYGYLEENSDLVEFISNISDELMDNYGIKSVVLEHYSDIEEGWEKLFISGEPVDGLSLEETESIEDAVMLKFLNPSVGKLRGRLVVSIG